MTTQDTISTGYHDNTRHITQDTITQHKTQSVQDTMTTQDTINNYHGNTRQNQ